MLAATTTGNRLPSIADAITRLRKAFAAFRRVEHVSIFDDPDHNDYRTIVVPVPDDAFEPSLRCGEFALIDVSDNEPVSDEGLFLVSIGEGYGRRQMRFVHLRHFRLGDKEHERQCKIHWSMCFGMRPMHSLSGGVSYAPSADGPLCDDFMRQKIVGRVIGVLGDGDRTLNWKRAAAQ